MNVSYKDSAMPRQPTENGAVIDQTLFALINRRPVPALRETLAMTGLFPYLEANGVTGVLFYHLQKTGGERLAPPEVYNALHENFKARIRRNMEFAAAARLVFRLLHAAAIPFVVLKGIALAEHVYPHFAMRTTSDLDVLIRREDLQRADLVLREQGFQALDSTPGQALLNPPGYLASLEYHRPGMAFAYVHLHWHLINTSVPATAFIDKLDMERLWEKAVVAKVAAAEVRLLGPEHLLVYLCEHALRVGHAFDRLILVCDIFYAVQAYADRLDWDNVAAEAKALGLLEFVYLGLTVARFYGGREFLSGEILQKFAPPALAPLERLFLHLQKRHCRLRGSSYLVYLALSKGPLAKGRLILHTLFPPRRILVQRVRRSVPTRGNTLYFLRIREIASCFCKLVRLFRQLIHSRR